jgi:hypothetical protein
MPTIETSLVRAQEIQATQPAEAADIFSSVLKLDPANLIAHNAIEKMHARQSFHRWMKINCVIDPRDDIFHFFANHESAKNPIREYLSDGWRTLSELMLLLEAVEQPLSQVANMLEFAAGFGRFTRHLANALPGRVTCAEVITGGNEFLSEQFGVNVFASSHDPEKIIFPEKYQLVFVLSMLTHIPIRMWKPWLQTLKNAIEPGGLLVFSVHNEDFASESGVVFDALGTYFVASSESPSIDGQIYGTTFTTRQFVENIIVEVFGIGPALYKTQAFWRGQDAVVIRM